MRPHHRGDGPRRRTGGVPALWPAHAAVAAHGRRGVRALTAYYFHCGQYDEACALVRKFHYSRRVPTNVQFVGTLHEPGGLFGDLGRAVAACFFSVPPTRWNEDVLELSRLVRDDAVVVALSALVSRCCRELGRSGVDLVVSYADSTQRHHGGIYQACSWAYSGKRQAAMDGVIIGGKFHPGRSCNSRFGTRSPSKLQDLLGVQVEPHYDEGKHLYWKATKKSGYAKAERLGLVSTTYPKPDGKKVAS